MSIQLTNKKNGNLVPTRPVITEEMVKYCCVEKLIKKELHHTFHTEAGAMDFIDELMPHYMKHKHAPKDLAKIICDDFDEKAHLNEKHTEDEWDEINIWTGILNSINRSVKVLQEEIIDQWGIVYAPAPPLALNSNTTLGKIISVSKGHVACYLIEPRVPVKDLNGTHKRIKIDGKDMLLVKFEDVIEA